MLQVKIIIEKTATGFSAYAEDYPLYTTGRTEKELMKNALEAASLHFGEERQNNINLTCKS